METDIFIRSKRNPIFKPNSSYNWESLKVYNPGAIYKDGQYHIFYRARGKNWVSSIGYAVSSDGESFERFSRPILSPEQDYERKGLEDPRVSKIGKTYFMTYTAYDGTVARLCVATSDNLLGWKKQGKVFRGWDWTKSLGRMEYLIELLKAKFFFRKDWCKAGAVFSEIIDGRYWMLFGDRNIWLAYSENGLEWHPIQNPLLNARQQGFFDNYFVEMGPPPIKTKKGWLVFYHGVDRKKVYRLGFLILDYNDPSKILYRTSKFIFEPRESYELSGIVDILPGGWRTMDKMDQQELQMFIDRSKRRGKMPRVTFVCGAVLVSDTIRIYYGASDTTVCTATASLEHILNIAGAAN